MILISACLAGVCCRYDGTARPSRQILDLIGLGEPYVLVCPESLAGLGIPRSPAEISGGTAKDVLSGRATVKTKQGRDVTEEYIKGARAALGIAREKGVKKAYLKEKSPCCGTLKVYDGTFSGTLRDGSGIFAELLKDEGIEIISI